jgi:hypothetical protein
MPDENNPNPSETNPATSGAPEAQQISTSLPASATGPSASDSSAGVGRRASDLTKTALGGPETADPKDGDGKPKAAEESSADKQADNQSAGIIPAKPEGYAIKFADEAQINKELLGQYQQMAHEAGLTQGQAQKLADLYGKQMSGLAERIQTAQFQALDGYIKTQNAELAKRPDYKNELVLAQKTLKEFGSEELGQALHLSAMGSHPAMWEFVVKVGKALGEPGFHGGADKPPETPVHERVWGKDGLGSKT